MEFNLLSAHADLIFITIFGCFRIGRLRLIKLIKLCQRQVQHRDRLAVDLKGVVWRLLSTGLRHVDLCCITKRRTIQRWEVDAWSILYYCFPIVLILLKLWNIYLILLLNFNYVTSFLWLNWTSLFFFFFFLFPYCLPVCWHDLVLCAIMWLGYLIAIPWSHDCEIDIWFRCLFAIVLYIWLLAFNLFLLALCEL